MRILMTLSVASMVLAGCMQDLGPAGDTFARDAAKGVVNNVVQSRFPGVDAAPFTDCIIDSASSGEILEIGQAALIGTTPATTNLVVEIASRPDTVRCAVSKSLGAQGLNL